jgi:hypothetical protein
MPAQNPPTKVDTTRPQGKVNPNIVEWYYFQYLLVTGLYLLEPWERYIFNTFIILFALFAVYFATAFVLPSIISIIA